MKKGGTISVNTFILITFLYLFFLIFSIPVLFSQEVTGESIDDQNSQNIDSSIENNSDNQNQAVNSSQVVETENQLTFGTPSETEEIAISSIGFIDIFRIFFILAIIIVVAYCVIWFLKRLQNKSLINSRSIEILSTQSLQQGNMLYVVKTGTSYFLLGATSQSISVIKEFSKKEERDELLLSLSTHAASSSNVVKANFVSMIRGLFTTRIQNNKESKNNRKESDINNDDAVSDALNTLRKNAKRGEKLNDK